MSDHKLHFDNILDWYDWQKEWTFQYVRNLYLQQHSGLIFKDKNSLIYISNSVGDLIPAGVADLCLYLDRIEFVFIEDGRVIQLYLKELQTINPQVDEKLEIIHMEGSYRSVGGRPGVSGLKWEIVVNAIWQMMGEKHKLSPYIQF